MIPNSEKYPATVTEGSNNGGVLLIDRDDIVKGLCGSLFNTSPDIGEELFHLITATRQIKSEANRLADEGDPDRGDYLWRLADEMQTRVEKLIDGGEAILPLN